MLLFLKLLKLRLYIVQCDWVNFKKSSTESPHPGHKDLRQCHQLSMLLCVMLIAYLAVDKLLVIGKEFVGHGRGDGLSLYPEAYATSLQNFVRKLCLQGDN